MDGLLVRMEQEDHLNGEQFSEEKSPIGLALNRAIPKFPTPMVGNETVMIGPHRLKLSNKVKEWIKLYDSEAKQGPLKGKGFILNPHQEQYPPIVNLVIDLLKKEIRFENE